MLKCLKLWERMRNANIIIHAKAPAGTEQATRQTPSTGNQREWSYSHFVLGNKCCLSLRGSCNCMPHMLSYMRLYNARTTSTSAPVSGPDSAPDLCSQPCSMQMVGSTPQHGDITIKKDSRALMSASWQRGVLADLQRSTTHTHTPPTHSHTGRQKPHNTRAH